eukprot:scaffold108380_cov17-Tisochrysis_lutea.AAC.2
MQRDGIIQLAHHLAGHAAGRVDLEAAPEDLLSPGKGSDEDAVKVWAAAQHRQHNKTQTIDSQQYIKHGKKSSSMESKQAMDSTRAIQTPMRTFCSATALH